MTGGAAQPGRGNGLGPSRPRRKRRAVRVVLPLLAGLMIVSGLVRLTGGVGHAWAEAASPDATATDPATAPTATMADQATSDLLVAFQEREARLAARETALADRAQALNVAEAEIREQLAALAEAEASLSALLALSESAAEDDLARLTAVYENMKPVDAAAVFAAMDPAFGAGFLGRMRPEAAAAILGNLDPAVAYEISLILAGRNAAAPTQ